MYKHYMYIAYVKLEVTGSNPIQGSSAFSLKLADCFECFLCLCLALTVFICYMCVHFPLLLQEVRWFLLSSSLLSISEPDVGVDECVLSVRWSEPVISCAGSVSQYVLSVTPPTSDCQSGSEDCVFMTDQTQYNLTVTANQTYNLTVRADDSCGNMGQPAKYIA